MVGVEFVSTSHAIESTLGAIGVTAHASEDQPVADVHLGHVHLAGDNVIAIAGHSEETAVSLLGERLAVVGDAIPLGVVLSGVLFELDAVHQDAVERVVETVIDMVAGPVVLDTLPDHPGGQLAGATRQEPSWLGYGPVAKGVVSGHLQGIYDLFGEFVGRESSSDVDHFHGMAHSAPDSDALPGLVHRLLEVTRSRLARPTVEMDPSQRHSHLLYLLELGLQSLFEAFFEVVSELVAEDGGQVLTVLLLDANPP